MIFDTLIIVICYLFFFFKQKTAYEMRISDWSSDVCSSDLPEGSLAEAIRCMGNHNISALPVVDRDGELHGLISEGDFFRKATDSFRLEIGRASCRERVCQ